MVLFSPRKCDISFTSIQSRYWRLFSVLLVFPLMIILVLPLSLITSLLIPANLFGAYRPVLIKTIETAFGWGVNIFWFYVIPPNLLEITLKTNFTLASSRSRSRLLACQSIYSG